MNLVENALENVYCELSFIHRNGLTLGTFRRNYVAHIGMGPWGRNKITCSRCLDTHDSLHSGFGGFKHLLGKEAIGGLALPVYFVEPGAKKHIQKLSALGILVV
jgi:hypothetical protein